eukprot:5274017-Pyramimonas_sp.AAC.1
MAADSAHLSVSAHPRCTRLALCIAAMKEACLRPPTLVLLLSISVYVLIGLKIRGLEVDP